MVRKEAGCGKCGVGNTGGGAQGHVRQAAENGLTWAGKSIIITLSPSLSALLPLFLPFPPHLPYPLFLCTYACVPLSMRSVHNYTWKSEVDILVSSQWLSTLSLEAGSLPEPGARQIIQTECQKTLAILPSPPSGASVPNVLFT